MRGRSKAGSVKSRINFKRHPPRIERIFNFMRNAREVISQEFNRLDSAITKEPSKSSPMPGPSFGTGIRYYQTQDIEYMLDTCKPYRYARQMENRNVTSCGYSAGCKDLSDSLFNRKTLPLRNLLKVYRRLEYSYIPWDGITARPILDWDNRIFAVLAGQPVDSEYQKACNLAYNAINTEGAKAKFQDDHLVHRRGDFPAVNVGVSHGVGTTEPVNLQNKTLNGTMERLIGEDSLNRISSFQDAAFELWAPKLHAYYKNNLSKIWDTYPHLRPGFTNSVWPCTAVNFGSKVYTRPHRDCRNLSFGWCSIVALGKFNPKKGGHLVLPDLRLIIEFPPGANILIPSALLTHCNIPVTGVESRTSFTQFCAGDLFRFVDCGLKTEAEVKKQDPQRYEKLQQQKRTRWKDGLGMYMVWTRKSSM